MSRIKASQEVVVNLSLEDKKDVFKYYYNKGREIRTVSDVANVFKIASSAVRYIINNADLYGVNETVETESKKDPMVHKPAHYNTGKIEVIDYILDKFHDDVLLGNVCKYISRSKFKGTEVQDLEKAQWYLQKKIEFIREISKK